MKKVAIIDIGSKSIKFFVGEKAEDGSIRTILDTNDIAALGEGLSKTGRISDEALERNAQSVATFAAKARDLGAEKIVSVGTMALRSAENSADFVARVKELCDVDVQIIPGEEEARLSYLAVLSGLPLKDGELVIFDTGGGSTEFIFGRGKELKNRFSVNLGSNRITEDFFADDPVKEGSVEKAVAQIDKEFAAQLPAWAPSSTRWSNTTRTLSRVPHSPAKTWKSRSKHTLPERSSSGVNCPACSRRELTLFSPAPAS